PISNFGTPATTTTNSFAFNSTPTTNLFGTNTQTKPFGSKLFRLSYTHILYIHIYRVLPQHTHQ
ncbi:hypothetical protein ALC56_00011, partial [Trachymyrmex septentrionalis]